MRGSRSKPEDTLFHRGDWHERQSAWRKKLISSIEGKNGDELLNTSTEDLAKYYAEESRFEVPVLLVDELVVDQRDTQVDVSRHQDRWITDRSRPHYIAGTSIDVEVPYSGDKLGFDIQPSTQNFNNPHAYVDDAVVRFSIVGIDLTSEQVKGEIDRRIASINTHLEWLSNDARDFNGSMLDLATQTIVNRKEKLLKDKSLVAGLGFKMKARPGQIETYVTPKVRRKIRTVAPKPTASREPFKPEPILSEEDYEHILTVLENMVGIMELSPRPFREMGEEDLRTLFLVQLNGHYLGNATGETFNYEGKTDILIKVDGKNIFIGECKFWAGPKSYLKTFDQVLSYLSWRDTKAAVLIFSRNKGFTDVLSTIEATTSEHSNFKKQINQRSESSWTYLFGHKDDVNREITITVQVYNVPEPLGARISAL